MSGAAEDMKPGQLEVHTVRTQYAQSIYGIRRLKSSESPTVHRTRTSWRTSRVRGKGQNDFCCTEAGPCKLRAIDMTTIGELARVA